MQQYSFLQEGLGGAVLGFSGGMLVGGLIDYIRSAPVRAKAAKEKANWLEDHKNDYTDEKIIIRIKNDILKNQKEIENTYEAIQELREDLRKVNSLIQKYKSEGYKEKSLEIYISDRLSILESIDELKASIKEFNKAITKLNRILDSKRYDEKRKEYSDKDAKAAYVNTVYTNAKHGAGIAGGIIGAALGGYVGTKLFNKKRS